MNLPQERKKTIVISIRNYNILKRLGNTSDSFDGVLSRVLKEKSIGLQKTKKESEL